MRTFAPYLLLLTPSFIMNRLRYYILFLSLLSSIACFPGERKRVALVLGGGGAKGAAEVGVLKYIEQSGVPIDYVVGTSIGSIVGGLYSVGYRSAELDSLFMSQAWKSLMTDRSRENRDDLFSMKGGVPMVMGVPLNFDFIAKKNPLSNIGALKGDSIVSKFERLIRLKGSVPNSSSCSFDSLPIPFRCVAVNVKSFKEVVLHDGSLAKAMRASMAIPFVFRPMNIDGQPLVDGGVLNNLPVDVAKAMGADMIIAIDLSVNEPDSDNPVLDADEIFEPLTNTGLFNMMDWGVRRPDIAKYKANRLKADLLIHPHLAGFEAQDFSPEAISLMLSLGEEAGQDALPALERFWNRVYADVMIDTLAVRESIMKQMRLYPSSSLKDLYKNFFQDTFGPGHLMSSAPDAESRMRNYLLQECEEAIDEPSPLSDYELTGYHGRFYRVNLSVINDGRVPFDVFFSAFMESARQFSLPSISDWATEWEIIEHIIKRQNLNLDNFDTDSSSIHTMLKQGQYASHHSKIYDTTYHPHYRLIERSVFEKSILPYLISAAK